MTIEKLSCEERDALLLDPNTGRPSDCWEIVSVLTDVYGEFGEPTIETTWEHDGVQIEDIRHPKEGPYSAPDVRPCEHFKKKI